MKTLSASFEIVTPMFIGGSDQQTAQLRPSSLKGALRFWWRALNWSRVCALHGSDQNAALRQLHADESRLFGHAATDNGGGQGVFLMQVSDLSVKEQKQPFGTGFDNGILYLLGQGLGSFRDGNHCLRPGLAAGGSFDLRLLFRPQRPQPRWLQRDAGQALLEFDLDPALVVFDGHFPGYPILPGIAQLDWAVRFGREAFALPPDFLRLEALKFQQVATPGLRLQLRLEWLAAKSALAFRYDSARGAHASGRVVFAEASA